MGIFLDTDGLLQVGGRLSNADLPRNSKHQILLLSNDPTTNLIIMDAHKKSFHGGPRLTEAILRQNYWVTNSQYNIKKVRDRDIAVKR